jgi:hypothetical protein
LVLGLISDPLIQDIAISIEQIKAWAYAKTQIIYKISVLWITDFKVGKFDPAEIFCFEPMHHGRHLLAGRSPKFEEFNKL